jgi:phenylacetate-CoA ligase
MSCFTIRAVVDAVDPEPAQRDPSRAYWDPETQTMPEEQLRELREERLREMLGRAIERPVPMFARKLAEAGIAGPEDVQSLVDLERVPLTVKQDLRDSEADHPPVGDYRFVELSDCARLGTSTGTTGTPTIMLWTRRDLRVEYECGARNWWRSGIRPGMIVTHAHPAYLYGGGPLLSGAYEYFGCLNVWVPPPDTDELAEEGMRMWMRIRPDIPFVGFALGRYFEVAAKLGLDPMKDVGLRIPSMPGAGGSGSPLATAGAECFAFLGGPCRENRGAHLADDHTYVQAVDPATGREVPDGEWGDLVVTTFGRDNCMIRYDLEEACRIERTPCPCGETSTRGWWGGRFKDLLSSQGRKFQVAEVQAALATVAEVAQPSLEFVVIRPREEQAPLGLRVEAGDDRADDQAIAERLRAAVKERLRLDASVELVDRGSLPRSGFKTARVVDG